MTVKNAPDPRLAAVSIMEAFDIGFQEALQIYTTYILAGGSKLALRKYAPISRHYWLLFDDAVKGRIDIRLFALQPALRTIMRKYSKLLQRNLLDNGVSLLCPDNQVRQVPLQLLTVMDRKQCFGSTSVRSIDAQRQWRAAKTQNQKNIAAWEVDRKTKKLRVNRKCEFSVEDLTKALAALLTP